MSFLGRPGFRGGLFIWPELELGTEVGRTWAGFWLARCASTACLAMRVAMDLRNLDSRKREPKPGRAMRDCLAGR